MVLLLTDEQRAFQDVAQRFAREKLAPHYQAREREGVIDRALVREMGSLVAHRARSAGAAWRNRRAERDDRCYHRSARLGRFQRCLRATARLAVWPRLARHASPDLASEWLPQIVAGESLFALALTEPRGGSDAGNLVVSARRTDNNSSDAAGNALENCFG